MNVLFLTLVQFETIQEHNIYSDLMREFVKNKHKIYIISPVERKQKQKTHIIKEKNTVILRLRIGNTQKTNIFEKGMSTVLIEPLFKMAIIKFFSNIKFDLVLYSTPPITLVKAIEYVQKRDNAKTYLMLKDIFPQNAVDIGMMSTSGLKGLLYKHFRNKELNLYRISDYIGCMSEANVRYVIKHNPNINPIKVGICANSIEIIDKSINPQIRKEIRTKYNIPLDKKVFVYGGNLGKPQGIPFLIKCIRKCRNLDNVLFLIVGDGTEYHLLEEYINKYQQDNVLLMKRLPKNDYDNMVGACDVGMIFLDHRFTIPNFPSRLLSYMQSRMPVLAVTDPNTDLGKVIIEANFGWWCESDSTNKFLKTIRNIVSLSTLDYKTYGDRAFEYLEQFYNVKDTYESIISKYNIDF